MNTTKTDLGDGEDEVELARTYGKAGDEIPAVNPRPLTAAELVREYFSIKRAHAGARIVRRGST